MFLDSTPLGVSLESPTIVIGKELPYAMERNDTNNHVSRCISGYFIRIGQNIT